MFNGVGDVNTLFKRKAVAPGRPHTTRRPVFFFLIRGSLQKIRGPGSAPVNQAVLINIISNALPWLQRVLTSLQRNKV